jgi:hypothetical protein
MSQQAEGESRHRERGVALGGGRKRNHNPTHDHVDSDAVKQAPQDGALAKKQKLTAGGVIDGGSRQGNRKVQRSAQCDGGRPTLESSRAEQSAGDALQNPRRLAPADECDGDVENPRDDAAP